MNKKERSLCFRIISGLLCILSIHCLARVPQAQSRNRTLFSGTIQFPELIERVPSMRVYYSGNKITCLPSHHSKKLLFSVPEERQRRYFYLLITEKVRFKTEENTIKYLKIDPQSPYKLYFLVSPQTPASGKIAKKEDLVWEIGEKRLGTDGRLPDNTIIICCDPKLVETLVGGDLLELPTIMIKETLLDVVGTEKKLHESFEQLLLTLLDIDTLHSPVEPQTKFDATGKSISTVFV